MMSHKSHWQKFFILVALEVGAAFFALALIPHEGSSFSVSRLALFALLLAFFILWIYFVVRPPAWLDSLARPALIVISALLSVTFAVLLFLLRYLAPELLLTYFQRLSPLLVYLLLLSLQLSFFLLFLRYEFHRDNLVQRKPVIFASLIALLFLFLVFIFISFTRIGLTPDKAYWGEPGVPVMAWQLALILLGGVCVLCLSLLPRTRSLDFILPALIWFLAAVIWLNVPLNVMQSSFYAPMNAPTFQPFPNSDAGYYDSMAHSLLIGYPYHGEIPTRPLYIVLLAILHLLVGEHYDLIIAGQTLVLAFFPVVLYYIGKKLHSRTAGVMIALFAIFRELTTLLVSSETRVSNTKTLLVDLPTFLLLALACLFALHWLERRDWKSAFVAGGMFGLLLLLRTQALLILPFILLTAFLAFGWKKKNPFLLLSTFFALGLVVSLFPWLLHNYLASGQITFEAPFELQLIASQYKYTGNLDLQSIDLQGKGLLGILLTFALKDPGFVFGFIATHFFATQISSVLALPLIETYDGLFATVNTYWVNWNGTLAWYNILLVLFYLVIIAIGLGASWKRLRWAGLLPLAFSLGYSLANGVGRFSGWRYAFPADWISYFYFSIGVADVFASVALLFGANAKKIFTSILDSNSVPFKWTQAFLLSGTFIIVSALPWMMQGIASPRYAGQTAATLTRKLSSSPAVKKFSANQLQLATFMSQPQAVLQIGRVLYPRFFYRGLGLASTHPWPAYAPRDFARMGFVLLNQKRNDALFQSKEIPDFPQAADAIILACQRQDYLDVRLILFPDTDVAYLSAPLSQPCSP